MSFDADIREWERAVETGDSDAIQRLAPAALRLMRLRSAELGSSPAEIAAEIDRVSGGLEGFFSVQAALGRYLDRPVAVQPVELRLNSVYQNFEASACIAIFDDEEKALAYYQSALLPKEQRYTDSSGYFRSFRSDSLCHNSNPHGGGESEEGHGILAIMPPWRSYEGTPYLEAPPPRNPPPLTGPIPAPPVGAATGAAS